jgi:hypothetical protein
MVPNCDVEIINPLHQIVAILGKIEAWPAYIIKLICIDDYNHQNVFQTASFFYGNKVPLDVVLPFYSMCNEHNRLLALCHFTVFYNMCNKKLNSDCTFEVCAYYNMNHKKLMWINRENPEFEQREIPLGIDSTGHAESIRARLQLMFG